MSCIIKPLITEKTSLQKENGKLCFKVRTDANKVQIKQEIEKTFGVKVDKVNTVNVLGKFKRTGKSIGRTNDWKKAIVVLKNDEKIKEYEELF
ncbi:MAG: 50S ribosomal protein L23 [Candidatus Margulisiibacteriota bacterium]|nr:MAG: 50S ribosomal protein L23 [Candidatus Margulisbacteria bacterium GWD2_39_127]OGI04639.1 MAG: 50S ribosomal protein L23 [Candidatus Margulisbacteria bacterium GWF2_38_17]OGI11829.1 MAG: 50S ribosomal protein L23 [Candidatus Margulisbacteria bacterium GWE2_39_32]PZM79799.1 MAG: 50S ribosomal protein L23 [Candidatus Margulisiibacteriota bacterium]HAR62706.1 50S ribosomal protein L23 [Candidatus Margulisiibacteriota bacterium]